MYSLKLVFITDPIEIKFSEMSFAEQGDGGVYSINMDTPESMNYACAVGLWRNSFDAVLENCDDKSIHILTGCILRTHYAKMPVFELVVDSIEEKHDIN